MDRLQPPPREKQIENNTCTPLKKIASSLMAHIVVLLNMKPSTPHIDPLGIGLIRQEKLIQLGLISRATLHRMKRRGLPSHRSGGTVWIDLAELRDFLKQT